LICNPLERYNARVPILTASDSIPYACQFASPELVWDFVTHTRDLATDPRWAEYGAPSHAEYAHWAMRACGVVCIKMAVEGLTGIAPRPVMDWVREGLAVDGYLTEMRRERPVEIGWKHAALADLARAHGCRAETASGLTLDDIGGHIHAGRVVIASVTSELGEDAPITRQTGHLIVVYGLSLDDAGRFEAVIAHNPSGRRPEMQAGATIPVERFNAGFSSRGIIVG
jgi:Peptidase_C39 like family